MIISFCSMWVARNLGIMYSDVIDFSHCCAMDKTVVFETEDHSVDRVLAGCIEPSYLAVIPPVFTFPIQT